MEEGEGKWIRTAKKRGGEGSGDENKGGAAGEGRGEKEEQGGRGRKVESHAFRFGQLDSSVPTHGMMHQPAPSCTRLIKTGDSHVTSFTVLAV